MKQCKKHQWEWVYPDTTNWDMDKRLTLAIGTISDSIFKRAVVCTQCHKTGHKINSRRSGIRVHDSDYFLKRYQEYAQRFNFTLPVTPALPYPETL